MSFALTEKQFLDGSKTVTRRVGWWKLQPGDVVTAVRKGMGLKKGERVHVLGQFRVVSVRAERLGSIGGSMIGAYDEVCREGLINQYLTDAKATDGCRAWFVRFFCDTHNGCTPDTLVNRIEFDKL